MISLPADVRLSIEPSSAIRRCPARAVAHGSNSRWSCFAELQRLQALGAAGKLTKDDLAGGTFTLSNIGIIGGTYTNPLLLVPQTVIGAVGRTVWRPRYREAEPDADALPVPTRTMCVSWSADHRVVDGVTLASFSNEWKASLELPSRMLLTTR